MNKLFLWTISPLLFVSCQSYDSGRGLSALGATTAGALAWELTENKSPTERLAWTAAAGLGAYAVGEHVRGKGKKQYEQGYRMGLADASKRQYELIQNRQKEDQSSRARFFLYEFPGVSSRNGVNFAPHTVKLRVQED